MKKKVELRVHILDESKEDTWKNNVPPAAIVSADSSVPRGGTA